MLMSCLLGGLVIALVTASHAAFIVAADVVVRRNHKLFIETENSFWNIVELTLVTCWLMGSHLVGTGVWTAAFLFVDAAATIEEAAYFALVCFTTLGFGDIIIGPPWRLLTGFAAANGLILFGVSTAFLIRISGALLGSTKP
ncbi:MAG: ion channel [Pseudomonadota bacterium]